MRKIIATILISALLTACSQEKSSQTVFDTTKLDSLFSAAVSQEHIPGGVALLKKGDEIIYHKAFGLQNLETKQAMSTQSIFRLASMTKGLTAVATLQLRDAGKLDLQDPISKYIPEFKNPELLVEVFNDSTFSSKPAASEITIHQLLTHTSGIGYGFQDDNYNALVIKNNISEGFCEDTRTSMENSVKIAALPLLAEPGTKNIYSMSYDVLSTIIEVVTNQRYDDYIQEHILTPLEMTNSFFFIPREKQHLLVSVYEPGPENKGLIPTTYKDVNYPIIENRQFISGGADLSGTAEDYDKFVSMVMNFGTYNGKQILKKESIQEMLAPQTPFNDGDSNQGFAAWVVNEKGAKNGVRNQGSFDFGGFFDTYSWADPKEDITAILMLQMYPTNAYDVHWNYQKIVYELLHKM